MKNILELIKNYQRPVRTILEFLLISFMFIYCLVATKPCNESLMLEMILIGFFADMGIYTVARTVEKLKNKTND